MNFLTNVSRLSFLLLALSLTACGDDLSEKVVNEQAPTQEVPKEEGDTDYSFKMSDGVLIATPPESSDTSQLTYQWLMYGEVVCETLMFDIATYNTVYSGEHTVTLITTDGSSTHFTSSLVDFGNETSNQPPVASFTFLNDRLTATSTDDAGADKLTHSWFADNQSIGNGVTLNTSGLTGTVTIKLISTDAENLSDSSEKEVDFGSTAPINVAPVAVASANVTSGQIPLSVTFDGSASTDNEDSTLTYLWNFGDGTSSSSAIPNKVFSSAGNYSVTLTVTDSQNASSTAAVINISATSAEVDLTPIAHITTSVSSGEAPLIVNFDASASSDDSGISTYSWDFGDGSAPVSGVIVTHTYHVEGIYIATLTVTDDAGQSSQTSTQISAEAVVDLNPIASFIMNSFTGEAPFVATFDASASSDDNSISAYHWDFGDSAAVASGVTSTHTYTQAGVYTATLTVTDSSQQTHTVTQTIAVTSVVAPIAPSANFITITSGLKVTVDATTSVDPEGGSLSCAWTFFDENGVAVNTATGLTASYDFATAGVKSITLVVTDADLLSDESTQTVSVDVPDNSDGIIIFSEDYEAQTVGENPAGWGVNIAYNIQLNPSATAYADKVRVVDDAPGRDGKALYVDGSGLSSSQNYSIMPLDLSLVGNVERVYVRYYMYATSNYIGNRATTPSGAQPNHNHFMSLGLSHANEMRIGEIKGALGANEYGADDIVPKAEYWYGAIETPRMDAGTWYCVESAFINDGDSPVLRTWLDDVLITEVDQASDWKNGTARDNWLDGFFGGVQLGWGNFGTYDNELYFDDVVASNERIGCDDTLTEPAPTLTPSFEITNESLEVMVDGTASTGSEAFTYQWDFDGEFTDTVSGSTASYTFTSAGDKTISLTLSSGSSTEIVSQTITIVDSSYDDLLSNLSANIVAHCRACHTPQDNKPIVFESSEPSDVEVAMSDYILSNSAQQLIDTPNGAGTHADIIPASSEQDWADLVYLVEAKFDGSGSVGNGNIIINDGFEGQTADSVPAGWKTFLSYQIDMANNNTSNDTFALIDSSIAHSGSNSVRIKTGGKTIQPAFIFQDLPTGVDAFYSRAWMYIPTVLGGGSKGADGNHTHFMSYSTEMSGSNLEELRYGTIQDGILGAFLPSSIDAGTENIVPSAEIPANEWVCVEFAMIKNSIFDQTTGWVNGVEIFNATSVSDWARDPGQFFSDDSAIANHVTFGWRAFGDNKGVEDIWFDDIVVSDEYIGCN